MITSTDAQIADWLARAHKTSSVAAREWASDLVAMLPLGNRFDAVRIRPEVVQAAASSDDWRTISEFLTDVIDGPVIHDPFTWYYALVPPQTTETWRSPLARCIGRGSWLGVPRTDRRTSYRPYWAVPMARAGDLCSPIAVAELIHLGHARLTEGAR
ncbi:hypothetical protein [Streptomyces spiramyceticus]|uniref:hypothetical protein n=1 Tax=Streptomyces spiramyceticus TaxID=299717 RepID=UPI00237A94CD|nr:hypothetical protein [Streptomyces spiramyceticus]